MFRSLIQLERESNRASFKWTQKDWIFSIWKDLNKGSNLESIIIIGKYLKPNCNLIHSRVHIGQVHTKSRGIRGGKRREQISKFQGKVAI